MAMCKTLTNLSSESWVHTELYCAEPEESSPRAVDISDITSFGSTWEASSSEDTIPLRLVTYNIHGWRDTFHHDNLDRIIALLTRLDADVIALQEVLHPYRPPADPAERAAYFERVKSGEGNGFEASTPSWGAGGARPYLEELALALGMPHMSFGEATSDGYFGRFGYGNAILSRRPIVHEEHLVVRPDPKHQAGRRIEAEDRCFTAVTLAPPSAAPRGSLVTVCVTHLDQLSDDLRLEQVRAMLARASRLGPHVLCGDFNVFQRADCSPAQWEAIVGDAAGKGWPAPPETTAALGELLSAGYRDCFYLSDNHRLGQCWESLWRAGMSRDTALPGATCWVTRPLLRIDYAFLSPAFQPAEAGARAAGAGARGRVRGYQRMDDEASDHFAVVVDLELGERAGGDEGGDSDGDVCCN